VLFKPEVGEAFGALVDSVGDVLSVPSTSIEWSSSEDDASAQSGQGEGCIGAGVCKLDGDLLLLLDPAKMLQSVQEKVLA
jgi:purine-binding chemotaxis protein CheW